MANYLLLLTKIQNWWNVFEDSPIKRKLIQTNKLIWVLYRLNNKTQHRYQYIQLMQWISSSSFQIYNNQHCGEYIHLNQYWMMWLNKVQSRYNIIQYQVGPGLRNCTPHVINFDVLQIIRHGNNQVKMMCISQQEK